MSDDNHHNLKDPEAGGEEKLPLVEVKSSKPKLNGASNNVESEHEAGESQRDPLVGFNGLTKEELENFAKDPFWKKLRIGLFVLFWIVWVGMLAAVIVIIIFSPKCPPRPKREFWQKPFYRLQVRSFAPSSFDSADRQKMGTIDGFKGKIDYLRNQLNVDNFLIDSLIARDASGCIGDFQSIDASLGSAKAFKELAKLGRRKGFSIVMDFDPSQSTATFANDNKGFVYSLSPTIQARNGESAVKDNKLNSPNPQCASLNVSAKAVRQSLEEAMRFWLDAGLSGIQLTNVAYLLPGNGGVNVNNQGQLFSNASADYVRSVRRFLDGEADRLARPLVLIVDPGNTGQLPGNATNAQLLQKYIEAGADIVVDTRLGKFLNGPASAAASSFELAAIAKSASAANGKLMLVSNWHYLQRDQLPALTVLGLTLPNVPAVYYGQELGMAHILGVIFGSNHSARSYLASSQSTDQSQTPMQWTANTINAGWLPNATQQLDWLIGFERRAEDIRLHNLATLEASGHPQSALQLTSTLLANASKIESLQWGNYIELRVRSGLFAFARKALRFPAIVVVLNLGDMPQTLTIDEDVELGATEAKLLLKHSWTGAQSSSYIAGQAYPLGNIFAPPNTALVFLAEGASV